jgi:two-component system, NtrC family, response regulator GlrR
VVVSAEASTLLVERTAGAVLIRVPRYKLEVLAGPDAGAQATSQDGRASVGTGEGATLRLTDPTVSRFHLEFEPSPKGVVMRDLGSTNGTLLGTVGLTEALITKPVELVLGRTRLRVSFESEHGTVSASSRVEFGELLGQAPAIREVFAALERAAPTNAPVLFLGESGTGKEIAARALHLASPRANGVFEVIDCGGLPAASLEDELFGHEAGALPGADTAREGLFERADGGTVFLDEIAELPLELQSKLLRILSDGEMRRTGASQPRTIDVRIIAAASRDLRRQINGGQFRADLYYRLAVIQIRMPALRERLDDLPLLVPALLESIARDRGLEAHVEPDANLLASLARHSWPGNVRELRNYLEHLVILRVPPPLESAQPADTQVLESMFESLDRLPLRMAKGELLERFERHYVTRLLGQTGGNVAEAARRAGVDRVTMFRTIRRHGLKSHDS